MASLVQPFVDKENAPAAGARKGRIASLGARPTNGKTFGSENPQTPRQVLGNISNDCSALRNVSQGRLLQGKPPIKKPDQPFKQPNFVKKPAGLGVRKPSTTNTPRQPLIQKKPTTNIAPSLFRIPSKLLSDNLPPMEKMHIFEDKLADGMNGLPAEHCLSAHLGRLRPLMPPISRSVLPSAPPFDATSLTFEDAVRPLFEEDYIPMPDFDSCLEVPPVESLDFLDINKIKLWDDEN